MKRVGVILSCYKMMVIMELVLIGLTGSIILPAAHANPALGTHLSQVNIPQETVLSRAEAALREAGFNLYPAGSSASRLGYSDKFTASIQTIGASNVTVLAVAVAGSDTATNDEAFRMRDFLTRYIQTGQSTGGGTGVVASPIDWGQTASSLRGKNGERYSYSCPAGGRPGSVWGTDVYTDDSSICTAAAHTGLITPKDGGVVTIEIRPGQQSYTGTTRNGVTTAGYGAWSGSYAFVGGGGTGTGTGGTGTGVVANPIDWGQNATALRNRNGQRFSYTCPAGGRLGSIWGTGTYTDDSSICTAAVHAGLITAERGGVVTIEIRAGQPSYSGSARNGITSGSWGNWSGSYVIVGDTLNSGGSNTGNTGDTICNDPRTLAIMDEWLGRALPPQEPGESLRYEAWGRVVGTSRTATITVAGPPDTRLTRCEWLWERSAQLRSTNNLGTLKEYVEQRRR